MFNWKIVSSFQVNEAAKVLHEYNNRLSAEMEDRKKLTTMLKDFQAEQRDLMAQAEQRLKVMLRRKCCAIVALHIPFAFIQLPSFFQFVW